MKTCDRSMPWTTTAILVVALLLSGCKDKPASAPTVKPPPGMTISTTLASAAAVEQPPDISDLQRVPDAGDPVAAIGPDGDLWKKYPSGLMVEELKVGAGRSPEVGQTVWVDYVATFPDSQRELDRCTKDHPVSFRLGTRNIIPGLNLALSTMRPGGRRKIFIPPDLAYGNTGDPARKIPPNQPLLYEMELLSITGNPVKLPDESAATRLIDHIMGPLTAPTTQKQNP